MHDDATSATTVTNTILWGDTVGSSVSELDSDAAALAVVSHSIVQGGADVPGAHIITANPLFVDAENGDLRLLPASPAIDAGNGCADYLMPTDQAGNGRWDIGAAPNVVDGLDIGAFEYQGTAGIDIPIGSFECP